MGFAFSLSIILIYISERKILDDKNIAYKCKLIGLGMDEGNYDLLRLIKSTGVNRHNLYPQEHYVP